MSEYRIEVSGYIEVEADSEDEAKEKAEQELNWAKGFSFDLGAIKEVD